MQRVHRHDTSDRHDAQEGCLSFVFYVESCDHQLKTRLEPISHVDTNLHPLRHTNTMYVLPHTNTVYVLQHLVSGRRVAAFDTAHSHSVVAHLSTRSPHTAPIGAYLSQCERVEMSDHIWVFVAWLVCLVEQLRCDCANRHKSTGARMLGHSEGT